MKFAVGEGEIRNLIIKDVAIGKVAETEVTFNIDGINNTIFMNGVDNASILKNNLVFDNGDYVVFGYKKLKDENDGAYVIYVLYNKRTREFIETDWKRIDYIIYGIIFVLFALSLVLFIINVSINHYLYFFLIYSIFFSPVLYLRRKMKIDMDLIKKSVSERINE